MASISRWNIACDAAYASTTSTDDFADVSARREEAAAEAEAAAAARGGATAVSSAVAVTHDDGEGESSTDEVCTVGVSSRVGQGDVCVLVGAVSYTDGDGGEFRGWEASLTAEGGAPSSSRTSRSRRRRTAAHSTGPAAT